MTGTWTLRTSNRGEEYNANGPANTDADRAETRQQDLIHTMCGIAGAGASREPGSLHRCLEAMNLAQRHRGPDADGIWISDGGDFGFAHRRLSIIDLSTAGNQPMHSADGNLVVCFNGEIYNYDELRKELIAQGQVFRTSSDTEVLLNAVCQWGLDAAVRRFVGMFAFALFDRREEKIHLVRDRMGVKPLYYSIQDSGWAFASELKAVRQARFLRFSLSSDALSLYLRYGYIPAPASIFSGIHKVPAGSIVTLRTTGGPEDIRRYWDLEQVAIHGVASAFGPAEHETALAELEQLMTESVRLRMVADVPVGAFLSGGIDSSLVVALMQKSSSRPVQTFTIGFNEPEFDESRHAAAIARHLGTTHHELIVTEQDLLDRIDGIANVIDEPFADASILPTLLVSELAASHLKVVLSGDGGDELFCGYRHYDRGQAAARLNGSLPRAARQPLGRLLSGNNHGVGKLARLGAVLAARSDDELCRAVISHYQQPARMVRGGTEALHTWLDDRSLAGRDIRERMMLRDMRLFLADDILHKVDRASMANSLEAREPLLDHRLVELAWRFPMDLRIRNGQAKWPMRQILGKYVPEALYERPKRGFGIPISRWLRGPLKSWAEDLLHGQAVRDNFDARAVRALWQQHLSGRHDRGTNLWDILIFVKWLECSPARD